MARDAALARGREREARQDSGELRRVGGLRVLVYMERSIHNLFPEASGMGTVSATRTNT